MTLNYVYKHNSTLRRLVYWIDLEIFYNTTPKCESIQSPNQWINNMYDKVSLPETFLTNYISSCNHSVQTSFDSHHLVIFIYLILITSIVWISIVIKRILRQWYQLLLNESLDNAHPNWPRHLYFLSWR